MGNMGTFAVIKQRFETGTWWIVDVIIGFDTEQDAFAWAQQRLNDPGTGNIVRYQIRPITEIKEA